MRRLHRRHLTSSQKAVVALEIEKYLAKEAAERRRAAISAARRREMVQLFAPSRSDKSRDQAATLVGTNRQYVSDAKLGK